MLFGLDHFGMARRALLALALLALLACPADAWRWNPETYDLEWEFTWGQKTYKFPIKRKPRPVGRPEAFCAEYYGVPEPVLFGHRPVEQRHGDGLRVTALNQTLDGRGQHRRITAHAEVRWRGKSIPTTQCHVGFVWHLPTIIFGDRYELDRIMKFRPPGTVMRVFEDWYWIGEKHAGEVNASALAITVNANVALSEDGKELVAMAKIEKAPVHNRYPAPVDTTDDWLGRAYVNATLRPPRVIVSCGSSAAERGEGGGKLGGEVKWEWLELDSAPGDRRDGWRVAKGSGVVDADLGADVAIWTAPAGVRSHYTFVWWTTLLAQWACAGWMCYATWAAPWPKHKTFVKGYYKHSPTCECCGLPMAPDHPGREKWQREKDEREKAEAEKAEAEKAEKAEKDADAKKDD